jgi:ABC-type multidrug transport system ATPase subunit
MNHDAWLAALTDELRRRGADPALAGHVVAEAASHLRDSGEAPLRTFGPPSAYARAVLESVGPVPARPAGMVRLRATDIWKRYGRRPVLRGVDLTVQAGQIAAIVGANGGGKSTLLRICAGLVSPDRGTVEVHGIIGYCPQEGGTSDFLRPDEHFVLVGAGRGLSRGAAERAGRDRAAALDWDSRAGQPARLLSGGTRQKLNLVLAELGDPDVMLLDEPYQGFDQGSYVDFWEQVYGWRNAGKAIVVVTHRLDRLDRVDTVVEL